MQARLDGFTRAVATIALLVLGPGEGVRSSVAQQPGTLELSFAPQITGPASLGLATVKTIALQSDGRILVGGQFSHVNWIERQNLARLHPDGSLDAAFTARVSSKDVPVEVKAVRLQSNGQILVAGNFDSVNGRARTGLARLNGAGSLDLAFNPRISFAQVDDVLVLPDGRLLICGFFSTINDVWRLGIARMNADGSLDRTFATGMELSGFARGLALQPGGWVLVRGFFSWLPAQSHRNLCRLDQNGALDQAFGPEFETFGFINHLVVQPDGGIFVGGDFDSISGLTRYGFARLRPDGTVDEDFELAARVNGKSAQLRQTDSFAVDARGNVVLAGQLTYDLWRTKSSVSRFRPDGSMDDGFQPAQLTFGGAVRSVVLQPDGRILLGGQFGEVNGQVRNCLARLWGDRPAAPPRDPPRLALRHLGNAEIDLSWPVTGPQEYRPQACTDLGTLVWEDLREEAEAGLDDGHWHLRQTIGSEFRAFRLQSLP